MTRSGAGAGGAEAATPTFSSAVAPPQLSSSAGTTAEENVEGVSGHELADVVGADGVSGHSIKQKFHFALGQSSMTYFFIVVYLMREVYTVLYG